MGIGTGIGRSTLRLSVAFLVAAVAAACASAGPPFATSGPPASVSPSPAGLDAETPGLAPTPTPTPTPTPLEARLVHATSCDLGLVPDASAIASPGTSPASSFRLLVPILTYHRVLPTYLIGNNMPGLVVSPDQFDAQLTALQNAGWRTVTLAQLAQDLEAGIDPAPRTFVITIDDGRYDGFTYALPILRQHAFVATYFIVVGRIGTPDNMSAADLVALNRAGMEVGNHTVDHDALTAGPPASLAYEVDTAEATLAALTGRWPQSFAYPKGKLDTAVEAAVRACGQIRIAVMEGGARPALSVDPYAVPRLQIGPGWTPALLLAVVERYAKR